MTEPLTKRLTGTAQEFFDYAERVSDAAGIGMVMAPHFTVAELENVGHLLTEAADAIALVAVELAHCRADLTLVRSESR